jgi:para-nitrobenzyl esterase
MSSRKIFVYLFSLLTLVLSLALFFSTTVLAASKNNKKVKPAYDITEVKTAHGVLKGYAADDVLIWKGVPYAKPPVNDLRWKAPQEPAHWQGVRNATQPAKKCTQLLVDKDWIRTGEVDPDSSEDCLFVDVYRPQRATYPKEKLPVYVWVHGGSNHSFSSKDYDWSALANRSDVVVVSVQYRLGPLGWLFHPAIQTGGKDQLADSGNFGTLDTIQALKWVNKNIAAFGGNPNNVLVTGESSGAHNTMNMVISPLAKGLFHKAMSESGGMTPVTPAAARTQANTVIEKLIKYKENVDAETAKKRRIEMEEKSTLGDYLRATAAGDFYVGMLKSGALPTFPVVEDGSVMPAGGWMPAIKAGKYNKMPIILGSNEDELKSFLPRWAGWVKPQGVPPGKYSWNALLNVLMKKDKEPTTVDEVLPTQHDRDVYNLASYYGGQNWKAKFVDSVARELANVQDDVYAYLFKWGGVGSGPSPFDFIYGSGHTGEICFFEGSSSCKGLFDFPFVAENEAGRKQLQYVMMDYLANFAWTGNPNSRLPDSSGRGNRSSSSYFPKWNKWSNAEGGSKSIVFDADFNSAKIGMLTGEVTFEGTQADLEAAMTSKNFTDKEKVAARIFLLTKPW